jgi:ABC-2 type transport system permease protein
MTPFSATLRSEWTKLISLRSTKVMLACSLILAIALSALLANVVGHTWDQWQPAERRAWEPIGAALVGGVASAILLGVTLAAALVCNVSMFLAAQGILGAYGLETASLRDGDALRAVLASSMLAPLFPLIALSLGFVLRSTAATIIAVLAVIFGPPFLGGVLAQPWQGNTLEYVPMAASDAIAIGHLPDAGAGLSPAIAALVVLGWLAVFLGAAWVVFERRDT